MTVLKSLSFSSIKDMQSNPVMERRAKLISKLEEQKALLTDPQHMRVEHHWIIQPSGIKERVEARKRVRAWWRVDSMGSVYLTVKYGAKAIEFEKGKSAVVVQDKTKLASVLDTLIEATRAGELDSNLAYHAKARAIPKAKR